MNTGLSKYLFAAAVLLLPLGGLFADGSVHLLDPKDSAVANVPPGSVMDDQAEWEINGYRVNLQFKNGVVAQVSISPINAKDHKPADVNFIAQFAPQNVQGTITLPNVDPAGVTDSRWQEWEIGDKVVRLAVDTYNRDNPSLDQKVGDLSNMRWMVRNKNSSTWW